MPIGLAIAGSAVAGLAGSALSSGAAESAAQTQAAAADQASANQLQQYEQTKQSLQPFTTGGTNALQTLLSTLGLPGGNGQNLLPSGLQFNPAGGSTFQPTQAQLSATPGYKFDLAQGEQAVANSNAATGTGVSGNALKAAGNYATGLANNTLTTQQGIFQQNLQNQQGIFQQNLGNVLNPLSNLVGTGENAAATTGQQGVQAVGQANQALIGGANAQAAGTVGSANAISSGLSSAGSAPLNYALYSQLLGGGSGGFFGSGGADTGSFD